jgi:hypothetical protein
VSPDLQSGLPVQLLLQEIGGVGVGVTDGDGETRGEADGETLGVADGVAEGVTDGDGDAVVVLMVKVKVHAPTASSALGCDLGTVGATGSLPCCSTRMAIMTTETANTTVSSVPPRRKSALVLFIMIIFLY